MQSVEPSAHRRVDSALRDLRGLDRTINQDVLQARFRLVNSYHFVLQSYRQIERLESILAETPDYLGESATGYREAVNDYRFATTSKQRLIEHFKYNSANLNSLVEHLAGTSAGIAQSATFNGEHDLAQLVHRASYLTLLYNITADYSGAPEIRKISETLEKAGSLSLSRNLRVRIRTFCRNILRLLTLKPIVDKHLRKLLDEPIAQHEQRVANIYYRGYAAAEQRAGRFQLSLYGLSLVLLAAVAAVLLRLQRAAVALSASNDQLEERVLQRTEELDTQHQELKTVLDNMSQALFAVEADGSISAEGSARLNEWLPAARPGVKWWDVVEAIDVDDAAWIEAGFAQLSQDIMPSNVILAQLPEFLVSRERHYRVEYREIFGASGKTDRILVVLSDITDQFESQQRETAQQEQFKVFQHFLHDRSAFLEFVSDGDALILKLRPKEKNYNVTFRAVHTLKGNCGLFGVQSIATLCHRLESELIRDAEVPEEARQHLCKSWQDFKQRLHRLTGEGDYSNTVRLHLSAMEQLKEAIADGAPAQELLASIARMQREPVRGRLSRLGDHAKTVATQLGKGDINILVEDGGVRLDAKRWSPFWAASVHLLHNAADHGLEEPGLRPSMGKSEAGTLALRTRYAAKSIVVEFEDDGRGINWKRLRDKAEVLGLIPSNDGKSTKDHERLHQLLFAGGLSTKQYATDTSGRGVGISAAFAACRELGGYAEIVSTLGKGTVFRFTIPDDDSVPLRPRFAPSLRSIAR